MVDPRHDKIAEAFEAVGGLRCPLATYSHVHGPNDHGPRTSTDGKHLDHLVVVEFNGTVSIRAPVAQQMGGRARPLKSIREDPLGYSNRASFGAFDYGFTFDEIQKRWKFRPEGFRQRGH